MPSIQNSKLYLRGEFVPFLLRFSTKPYLVVAYFSLLKRENFKSRFVNKNIHNFF